MKRLAWVALAVSLLVLAACGALPAARATQTAAVATTAAAAWTATPTLTATPPPTATPTQTATPLPTNTPRPTTTPRPSATRAASDGRYVETAGEFSYVPPIGWLIAEYAGLKNKIAYGTPISGFAPNLIFVDDNHPGRMEDYVAASLEAIDRLAEDAVIISQEPFTPTQRLPAVKLVIENTQNGIHVRQTLYFFEGWSRKIVATYTRPSDQGERNDTLVEASMLSFQLLRLATPTPIATTSGVGLECPDPCGNITVFRFTFPFEPSQGYLIEINSEPFSAEVMCALEEGETTGRAVDLNDTDWVYGVCDTASLTLDGILESEVTVTVILGGFPVVNGVTRGPSSIVDYSTNRACRSPRCVVVEYDFTGVPLEEGPIGRRHPAAAQR